MFDANAGAWGAVLTAAGALVGVLFSWLIQVWTARHKMKMAEDDNALEKCWRAYNTVTAENQELKDKLTPCLVECERRGQELKDVRRNLRNSESKVRKCLRKLSDHGVRIYDLEVDEEEKPDHRGAGEGV